MIHIKAFTFSPISENTYVLYNDAGKAIIVDPGCYFPAEEETLKSFLSDKTFAMPSLICLFKLAWLPSK